MYCPLGSCSPLESDCITSSESKQLNPWSFTARVLGTLPLPFHYSQCHGYPTDQDSNERTVSSRNIFSEAHTAQRLCLCCIRRVNDRLALLRCLDLSRSRIRCYARGVLFRWPVHAHWMGTVQDAVRRRPMDNPAGRYRICRVQLGYMARTPRPATGLRTKRPRGLDVFRGRSPNGSSSREPSWS